ncbi:MAG: amino acid permease [Kiritimatiellae bacterium]|nr:amino acid permease [Kiritimatiellia bacterium]
MKYPTGMRHLSAFSAWALAFGCAVGWDAVVMPWTTFLPKAGPLGTLLGLLAAGFVMAVIAWNFHYMINQKPGPGGVYTYATAAFGHDHGYLCAWFLCLTYAAIVWLDATALPIVVRYVFGGDSLRFGFCYTVEGFEVCLGDILLVVAAAAIVIAICARRRVSTAIQTVLAVVFAVAFAACFVAAAICHDGGLETMKPLFSPQGGGVFSQMLSVLMMAPWLFIGFEAISVMSIEFRFPGRRAFSIMVAVIVAAVAVYAMLTVIPVLASGSQAFSWVDAVDVGHPNAHAFEVAQSALGKSGKAVICCALFGAIFTNLIGNTMVASRLIAAMAHDGAMPAWLGRWNGEISARNPMIVIVCMAVVTSALGQTVIGVIVDIALIGAAIAYAYTSAATFKIARQRGDRFSTATGLAGLVISVVVGLLFMLPVFSSDVATMSTESYLVLVLWGVAGLALFLFVFRCDSLRRFGRSPVVWAVLLLMILVLSLIWVRQTADDTTRAAYEAVASFHSDKCLASAQGGEGHAPGEEDWHDALRRNLSGVSRTIMRDSYVQGGINVLALVLLVYIYGILRRREREMEEEKAKAKSYFFSTVSHDIRTPLNAIIGFSELLKAGFATEKEREQAVESILVSSKTLLGLINDVLDLSKLESGKMQIVPEPTDAAALLRGVVDAFRVSGGKPGLEIRCRAEGLPMLILDPQRLRQIAFNLVGNAMKFTVRGHVELRAFFEGSKPSYGVGTFRLEVEDTGCGIGETDLKRLGSAYVQVGEQSKRVVGTGLGLAICRQLATAMGGALKVESELGKGSTFSIVVPGVRVTESGGVKSGGVDEFISQTPNSPTPNSLTSLRVLVAADAKMNLMVMKALLSHIGSFDITVAMDGAEALKTLETASEPFDLVLTDMWMPNLDGEGLVKAIRANPKLASLRVVAVTADVEYQTKAAAAGFDGILLKPVTSDKLLKMLAGRA